MHKIYEGRSALIMISPLATEEGRSDLIKVVAPEMESTAPLKHGYGSFSERNICAPAWLQDWDSLRMPALICAHKIISLVG